MQTREEINREDDIEDGGEMCLPMCSGRRYTNNKTHLGFFLSSAVCGAALPVAATLFTLASLMSGDDEIKDFTIEVASTFGAAAAAGFGSAITFFFCGTKKVNQAEPDEEASIIQGMRKNSP